MDNNKFAKNTNRINRDKLIVKIAKLTLLILMLLLVIVYIVFRVIYNSGNFSITLDRNMYLERGLVIYDDPEYKQFRGELFAKSPDTFNNISSKWLPDDVDNYEGSHNGDNYLAYTFYIENTGTNVTDYWTELIIDDVIKNVDEAVRVRIYKNGVPITYAKIGAGGYPERDTTPFESNNVVVSEHVIDFSPGDIDKYTILIWLEGTDPECTDNILGGEIKLHMEFISEIIDEKKEKENEK